MKKHEALQKLEEVRKLLVQADVILGDVQGACEEAGMPDDEGNCTDSLGGVYDAMEELTTQAEALLE